MKSAKKPSKYKALKPDQNGVIHYPERDNNTWRTLIQRQNKVLPNRACSEFIHGLALLNFSEERIPQCHEVNEILQKTTGWAVERVPALIPADQFFMLLSEKKFPAASFIRFPEELDYLEEPDIFHELYGHCPLLTNQAFADFVEAYGKLALSVSGADRMKLFRLFWFTVEFGLIQNPEGLRIYGGGILSSYQETLYALDPNKKILYEQLTAEIALRTPYKINELQPLYFIINKFEDLYQLMEIDLLELVNDANALGDLPFPNYDEAITEKSLKPKQYRR